MAGHGGARPGSGPKRRAPTQEQIDAYVAYIAQGVKRDQAAPLLGCHAATAAEWIRIGEADLNECKDTPYARLAQAVYAAEAVHVADLLGVIRRAANRNWIAAAWILERRYAYIRPPVNSVTVVNGSGNDVSTKQAVDDLIQRIAEGDKKAQAVINRAKPPPPSYLRMLGADIPHPDDVDKKGEGGTPGGTPPNGEDE